MIINRRPLLAYYDRKRVVLKAWRVFVYTIIAKVIMVLMVC